MPKEDSHDELLDEQEIEDISDEEIEAAANEDAPIEEKPKKKVAKKKAQEEVEVPAKRFEAIRQPEVIGIMDNETGQLVTQVQDGGLAMALSEILERLERIEKTMGSLLGE